MEINDNPYKLFEYFKRDVRDFLIKKVRNNEIDLTLDEANRIASEIEFTSVDHHLEWASPLTYLLDEDTTFELGILWMKILNP